MQIATARTMLNRLGVPRAHVLTVNVSRRHPSTHTFYVVKALFIDLRHVVPAPRFTRLIRPPFTLAKVLAAVAWHKSKTL